MVVELDTSISNEVTLAMIKPDAVAAGKSRDIMHAIESNGFHIIAKKYIQVSKLLPFSLCRKAGSCLDSALTTAFFLPFPNS